VQWLHNSKDLINIVVEKFNPDANSSDAELYNVAQLLGDLINHARREFIDMQEYATTGTFYSVIIRFCLTVICIANSIHIISIITITSIVMIIISDIVMVIVTIPGYC
jgi:hypothetical protein